MGRIESAAVIFLGGLLMLLGVYLSYLVSWAYYFIGFGVVIFLFGLHLDLRRVPL